MVFCFVENRIFALMRSCKLILTTALLLLSAMPVGAKEPKPKRTFKEFAVDTWKWFSAPKSYMDSGWIYQPKPRFDISASYKARWNGVSLEIPYAIEGIKIGDESYRSAVTMKMKLMDRTSHNVGLYVGYGPVSLGYSLGIGQNKKLNRVFSFDWVSSFYGVQFYYGRFFEQIDATAYQEDNTALPVPFTSLANLTLIQVDGYYAINRKKFSYQAAYKGRLVQRRSAGSIMAGIKYLHTGIMFDPVDDPTMGIAFMGMCGYGTDQVSIGAGYSYNFVPYNKDNVSNLTINLTAIPLLTFVNEIHTVSYDKDNGNQKTFIHGKVQPNFIARAAVSYSVWHLHFCARFDFQYNQFRTGDIIYSAKDMDLDPEQFPDTKVQYSVKGHIRNWIAGLDIHYIF